MELVVAVALIALAAAVVGVLGAAGPRAGGPIDVAGPERALVRWVRRHPQVARVVRLDMTTTGVGASLVALGFVLAAAIATVLGLLLRGATHSSTFASWDRSLSRWGVDHADRAAVDLLELVTQLGGTPAVVVACVVVAALDLARHRQKAVVGFLAAVVIGQNVLVNVLKVVVDRDRPDVLQLVGVHGPSFPSGHSTAAAACWAALALVLSRRSRRPVRMAAAGAAVLVAVAVAASRALLGVHWATDVMAGVALGWAWFTFVAVAFGGRLQRFGEPGERLGAADAAPAHAQR